MAETPPPRFSRLADWLIPRRNKVHLAVFLLSILMIPGALTALEPIDMEAYEMESPELTAQEVIATEFETTEIILGFAVSLRDPSFVGSTPSPVPFTSDGIQIGHHLLLQMKSHQQERHGKELKLRTGASSI